MNLVAINTLPDEQLGRYRLVAQLGQGGMGTIYLAINSGLGEFRKLLVIKELQRELARNEQFVSMFLAEAKLAARLNHPNIVQTIEAGEQEGRYFLAMEFLDGQPLTQVLKRAAIEPQLSIGTRIQVLCDVLAGLHYAHELCDYDGIPFQIVHRDVNPHNVFVTYHGQVKLVDFGIAKAADVEALTTAGVFKGKFAYAAPEQVRGDLVDRRSDLFAVGVMLWEAIAMRRFAAGSPTQASLDQRLSGSEPRISDVVPTVEPLLAEICDRAMHVDRNQRYPTAEAFRTELQRFLLVSGEAPSVPLDELMNIKFTAERTAVHRLIDAHVKRDDRSQSMVRSLAFAPGLHEEAPPDVPDPPTLVGDLTQLIESSRVDNPMQSPSKPPRTPGGVAPVAYASIAAVALAGVAGYLALRPQSSGPESSLDAATTTTTTPASPLAPPPPTVVPAPEPAYPPAIPPAVPPPDPPRAAPTSAPAAPPPVPSRASTPTEVTPPMPPEPDAPQVGRRRQRLANALDAEHPLRERGSRQRALAALTESQAEPVRVEPASPPPARVQPSAARNHAPNLLVEPHETVEIGADLRKLPRRPTRPIDTTDPFQ